MLRAPLVVLALLVIGCEGGPECETSADCERGDFTCINGRCQGPPCTIDDDCPGGLVCSADRCRLPDAGAIRDAGREDGGRIDASGSDAGNDAGGDAGRDAGRPVDAGRDGGRDAGPPCECTPGQVESIACGNCGLRSRSCDGTCRWGGYGACTDSNSRCGGTFSPVCRNDYCWGFQMRHQGGVTSPSLCLDFNVDHLPADGGAWGSFDIEVYGRPGAQWFKQNQRPRCSGPSWTSAESGVLNASGVDTDDPFVYGLSDCANGSLGLWESRVQIRDTDGSMFYLPTISVAFFNGSCAADRNSCAGVATYCPAL